MGEVYRARDERLGRTVALKVLPEELATNAEAMRRFEQEARAASALNHPNIVTLYEIGHSENIAWMAMELVEGTDLRSTMVAERMNVKNTLRIAVKLADGLAAAHDRGIAHRDLKPENVMITSDGFVKILDFGLAKQLRLAAPSDTTLPQTTPGTVFGTIGYMSPEQALGNETDHRTDQFALGVMLYEMLTGVRPFDRPSKPETLVAIIRDEVSSPSQLAPGIPADVDRILARCLAKSPRDRYASTRDLARDLRDARQLLTNESGRIGSGASATARRPSMRYLAAGAVLAAAVTVGSAVMWVRQPEHVAAEPARSLVLVPFRDMSGTAEGRLLAEGLSELVAAHLGESKDLRVTTAPASLISDLRALRKRTGAEAIIRGAVQTVGDRVRVSWSMIDATGGARIDGQTVTGSASDLFALEDSVAQSLLRVLRTPVPREDPSAQRVRLGPEAQKTYVEVYGMVRRPRDEQTIDDAIERLESLLRDHRDSAPVNALIARAMLNKSLLAGRAVLIEQAVVYARRAVTLDPSDREALTTLGVVQSAIGEHEAALGTFDQVQKLHGDRADVFVGRADALQMLGRGAEAEAAYRKAIELKRDDVNAFVKYGVFCFNRGDYELAAQQFERAVELSPESAHVHLNYGSALYLLGRYDEAMKAFERSNEISPNSGAFTNIGTIHFFAGRYVESCRAFERATELSPSDYHLWANLADAYRWTPSRRDEAPAAYARAIETARESIRVNERDLRARITIAAAHAKSGDLELGRREIQSALEINPTHASALYTAALIAHMEGRHDSAMSWLERAVAAGYSRNDLKADPEWRSVREDEAFRAVLAGKFPS